MKTKKNKIKCVGNKTKKETPKKKEDNIICPFFSPCL